MSECCSAILRDRSQCRGSIVFDSGFCSGHLRKQRAARIAAELEARAGSINVGELLEAADTGDLAELSSEELAVCLFAALRKSGSALPSPGVAGTPLPGSPSPAAACA